jgi:hypothetical protein
VGNSLGRFWETVGGVVGNSLRRFQGTSRRGPGRARRGVARALAHLRPGTFRGHVEPWIARPLKLSWRRRRGASPAVCGASGWDPSRSLARPSRERLSSVRRGSRRAPSRACEERHQGWVRVSLERPILGVSRGGLAAARRRWLERSSSVLLLVSRRRLECPRPSNRRSPLGRLPPFARPSRPAPRGVHARPCDGL